MKSILVRIGLSLSLVVLILSYQNCGSHFEPVSSVNINSEQEVPAPDVPVPDVPGTISWVVSPEPTFLEGGGGTLDLTATLPAGVAKGGVFAIDPSGAQLPAGMTLSSSGILSVGNAVSGSTAGVVFSYTEL